MVRFWSPFSNCGQMQLLKTLNNLVHVHMGASDRAAKRAQVGLSYPLGTSPCFLVSQRAKSGQLSEGRLWFSLSVLTLKSRF